MTRSIHAPFALAFLTLSLATAAQAQEAAPAPSAFDGDYLIVGAAGVIGPSYEGSDDSVIYPMGGIMGRVGGIGITPRKGGGIALDVIPDPTDSKVSFTLGPVARIRSERTGGIKDPVVIALGERDTAVELGGTIGIGFKRLTNPYDNLSASVDVRWDVAGAHKGQVITPSISYLTPLNRGLAMALVASAEHVDDDYAHYYYDITPAGSAASGLPTYTAKGGWKNVNAMLIGIVDLDGNLRNGGFALVSGVSYSRLLGSIADSPIVAQRGSADQFSGAIGIAYTF